MRMDKRIFVAGTMVLSLVACSDQLADPLAGDAERAVLTERVRALAVSVTESGEMNDRQRREFDDIRQHIQQWQSRTGRTDLSVSNEVHSPHADQALAQLSDALTAERDDRMLGLAQVARLVSNPVAVISRPGPTVPKCLPCPPVSTRSGKICFLINSGICDPATGFQLCGYACIWD